MYSYARSICAAQEFFSSIEKCDGGGSSHGLWEVIYRLHATRLKTLLRFVKLSPKKRSCAEIEALRLTEEYWYDDIAKKVDSSVQGVRQRLWNVFCDIVMALSQCRKEHPFFHRSVYRHAQALLWAPIFLENIDEEGLRKGSLMRLTATQCQNLIGMDDGKTCAENAKHILEVLFEKKRSQLCAVWLTTPARPNVFEFLNDFNRKFNSLRWKYCKGYIDCLRLCKDINTLQTIINWIDSATRDIPSFYEKSAAKKGAAPKLIHHKDNLLIESSGIISDLTCYANWALADVIRQLLRDLTVESTDLSLSDAGIELLYNAYSCFRRLNCPINDDTWKSMNVRKCVEERKIAAVEAICECYLFTEDAASYCDLKVANMGVETKMYLLTKAVEKAESIFSSRIIQLSANRKRNIKRKVSDVQ